MSNDVNLLTRICRRQREREIEREREQQQLLMHLQLQFAVDFYEAINEMTRNRGADDANFTHKNIKINKTGEDEHKLLLILYAKLQLQSPAGK